MQHDVDCDCDFYMQLTALNAYSPPPITPLFTSLQPLYVAPFLQLLFALFHFSLLLLDELLLLLLLSLLSERKLSIIL